MNRKSNLEKQLANIRVKRLTAAEKDRQRDYFLANLPSQQTEAKWLLLLNTRVMAQIILTILIVLGGSIATVKAADNAKPGDLLFPLDRAWEEVRIALAPDSKKTELELEFAQERVREVASLVSELSSSSTGNNSQTTAKSVTSTPKFTTPTSTSVFSGREQKKLEKALAATWQQLLKVKTDLSKDKQDLIQPLLDELARVLESLPAGSYLKVEVDNDGQEVEIEVKEGNRKREVEFKIEKDGKKMKIESRDRELDRDYSNDNQVDERENQDQGDDQINSKEVLLSKIEVKIENNKSEIEIKWNNGQEEKIKLNQTNLSDLLSYLSGKYNISPEEIQAKWKVEYQNLSNNSFDELDKDQDDERQSSFQDGGGVISSTSTASQVYSIEIKVKGDYSEIEVKSDQGEEKINSNLIDYNQLVEWLSKLYQISKEELKSKIKFEVDDEQQQDEHDKED